MQFILKDIQIFAGVILSSAFLALYKLTVLFVKQNNFSSPVVTPQQQEMSSLGVYPEGEAQSRRYSLKGKVDVKGLMKKRRVTSGRAPSLTRRSSADHAHDDHDHDGHGHVSLEILILFYE